MNNPNVEIIYEYEGEIWNVTLEEICKELGYEYGDGFKNNVWNLRELLPGRFNPLYILEIKINGKTVFRMDRCSNFVSIVNCEPINTSSI